jgi:hypothetical protein
VPFVKKLRGKGIVFILVFGNSLKEDGRKNLQDRKSLYLCSPEFKNCNL